MLHNPSEDWLEYTDPAGRFLIRRPPTWTTSSDQPDRIVFQAPGRTAEISVHFADHDCETARSEARKRRLNYFLVREFARPIGSLDTGVLEFRDTIAGRRVFQAFLGAEGRCCELRWTLSDRSEGQELESALDKILSTFKLLAK
jgi:hypothetical protein